MLGKSAIAPRTKIHTYVGEKIHTEFHGLPSHTNWLVGVVPSAVDVINCFICKIICIVYACACEPLCMNMLFEVQVRGESDPRL